MNAYKFTKDIPHSETKIKKYCYLYKSYAIIKNVLAIVLNHNFLLKMEEKMSLQHASYQKTMWLYKLDSVLNYTNLIIKDGLNIEEVAKRRNVSVDEVNSVLNVLRINNLMLYEQIQEKLNS